MTKYSSEHTFEHPWDTVVQAAWRKYPNPLNPNVTGVDVLKRKTEKNGTLRSHRLMVTQWILPSFVNIFLGINNPETHVTEHSVVNKDEKCMTISSTNLTLSNYIKVDEKLKYMQHPDKPNCTLLQQEATIRVQGLPFSGYLEGLVFSSCTGNVDKGRECLQYVIDKIKKEQEETRAAQALLEEQRRQLSLSNSTENFNNLTKSVEEQIQCLTKSAEVQIDTISKLSDEHIHIFKNSFAKVMNFNPL